jgi:NADPH:quinone reductase-like Zn-dependent oxidoreductase
LWARFPVVLGFDISGTIVEAGPGTKKLAVGDPVFARLDARFGGAYAQYAVVGEGAVARRPNRLSAQEAAAVPLAALTALQGLRDYGKLTAGQRILIVGGSGGVGHFAIQIAKAMGAYVIASASTRNLELLRSLGADQVIDYRSEPYTDFGTPYDLVFDTVAADSFSTFAPLLSPRGRFVGASANLGLVLRVPLNFVTGCRRIGLVMMKPSAQDLEQLGAWIDQGELRPVLDRTFPLAEVGAAHAYAEQGRVRGKVVIDVAQP